jgi:protein tyrosine phosphatase (PTP) superfamily phosphohydrolase (DUF442 family)
MDISRITSRLFISSWPEKGESVHLHELGIRLVISMTTREPLSEFCIEPLAWLHLRAIDSPLTPIPLDSMYRGVLAALPVLADGDGVLCHCREGRHRSVAMACAILIAQGCTAERAMELVKERRAIADPGAFWIAPRIRKFERAWLSRWRDETDVPESATEPECR